MESFNWLWIKSLLRVSHAVSNNPKKTVSWIIIYGYLHKWKASEEKNLILTQSHQKSYWDTLELSVDLVSHGVVIFLGGLIWIVVPGTWPTAAYLPFIIKAGHLTWSGKKLGTILMGLGVFQTMADLWDYFFQEKPQTPMTFIPTLILRSAFANEVFKIIHSNNPQDRLLAGDLLFSPTEDMAITHILHAIEEDEYSISTRQSAIRALRAFPKASETMKDTIISTLKNIIDKRQNQILRLSSLNALAEVGKKNQKVLKYLETKGNDTDESDEFRLLALIGLGRDELSFPTSVQLLASWLGGRDYRDNPLRMKTQLEIPGSFRDLLFKDTGEHLTDSLIVIREFVRSGILDLYTLLRFSNALIHLDSGLTTQNFLREVYSGRNLIADIESYVEELLQESESQEDDEFLELFMIDFKDKSPWTIIERLKPFISSVQDLKNQYSKESPIIKKLTDFLEFYENILQFIQ